MVGVDVVGEVGTYSRGAFTSLVNGKNGKLSRLRSYSTGETKSLSITEWREGRVVLEVSSVKGNVTHDGKVIRFFKYINSVEYLHPGQAV